MITEEHKHFMQIALDLSQCALDCKGEPFGAIVVKNGNIVGSSGAYTKREIDSCTHAEVLAIRHACRNLKSVDLSGCHIYCSSEPCPMCLAAIYWAQISSVYYCKTEDGSLCSKNNFRQEIHHHPVGKKKIKSIQISASKAREILERDPKHKSKHTEILIPD